ncbi:MAG: hypothetical protein EA402_01610 [Planctomycetota bacterium]|nr:MAG: hypothetical protein EA402_01610 [Planctomycetota bacterium]
MWLVDALYILIAVAIASALVWTAVWPPLLALTCLLLLVLLDRRWGARIPRGALALLMVPSLSLWLFVMSSDAQALIRIPLIFAFTSLATIWAFAMRGRRQTLSLAAIPLLCALSWLLLGDNDPQARQAAAWMGIYGLVTWPFLSFLLRPHWMLALVPLGCLFLLGLVRVMVDLVEANPAAVGDIFRAVPFALINHPMVPLQIFLFLLIVVALLMYAGFRWIFLALTGLAMTAMVFWLAGGMLPQQSLGLEHAPILITLALALLALCVGSAGIIGSARRPGNLTRFASRTLSLGILITAIEMGLMLIELPAANVLVSQVAKALAPLLMALLLTGVVGLSVGMPRGDDETIRPRTERLRRAWGTWRNRLFAHSGEQLRGLSLEASGEVRRLGDPWRLLPLLIFAAAWPAIILLDQGLGILLPFALIFFTARWIDHYPLPWLVLFQACIAAASWSLGHPPFLIFLHMILALTTVWPFLRWPSWDAAFSYPLACLMLTPLWLYSASADPTQIILGVGCLVLLVNALRRGPLRWGILAVTVGLIGIWLTRWVLARDPFTTIILLDIDLLESLLAILYSLPLMMLLLTILWISRFRGAHWWLHMGNRELGLVGIGIILCVAWAIGVRDAWWIGGIAAIVLLALGPDFTRQLRFAKPAAYRHPLTAALAISLMILLVSLASAIAILPSDWSQGPSELRVASAGALGPVYLQALRDMMALLTAALLLISWQIWARHGNELVVATSTFVRRRDAGLAPAAKARRRLVEPALGLVLRYGTPLWLRCRSLSQWAVKLWLRLCRRLAAWLPKRSTSDAG